MPGETFGLDIRTLPGERRRCHWCRFRPALGFINVTAAFIQSVLLAAAIYFACEYFVNGVEWVGQRFRLGATTTGTVLAAFGTALPESAVTFVAVVFGRDAAQKEIGVGAALGGPLVLATIAYSVVGVALLWNRRRLGRSDGLLEVNHRRLSHDQAWFLAIFVVKVGLGLVAFAFKPALGVLFLAAYGAYLWREMRNDEPVIDECDLEPLKFRPHDPSPPLAWAALQTLVALAVIGAASHAFVGRLETIATGLGWAPQFVALLLSPIATELPETLNAVIWVRQGRERLALATISGAMMIQATIPSALGLFFTPWLFDHSLLAAGAVTAVAVAVLWLLCRRGNIRSGSLVPLALLYVVFGVIVAVVTHGS
jgi:cation:H+ antiporter